MRQSGQDHREAGFAGTLRSATSKLLPTTGGVVGGRRVPGGDRERVRGARAAGVARRRTTARAVVAQLPRQPGVRGDVRDRVGDGDGVVVAPLAAAMVAVGHLRLDIHGFAAILLGQAAWMAGAAVVLWRAPAADETDAASPGR